MDAIANMKTLDKAWVNQVEKLKETVEHHVKDEEGKMFRVAKNVLTEKVIRKIQIKKFK